jgi:hypothetical protein
MAGPVCCNHRFAANALESAKAQGREVDDESLDLARDYQKANFDVNTVVWPPTAQLG